MKIGIDSYGEFFRRICQAILMGGIGFYVWSEIGLGKTQFETNVVLIGYMSILILFTIALKQAFDEVYLYDYKRNGIPVRDMRGV